MGIFRLCVRGYGALAVYLKLLAAIVITAGAAQADPVRIAAFGDSLTAGYGLTPEAGFVPQLENWLKEQGADVELINAGVSGDTTAGGLSRIGWTLDGSVDAMIVALGANDYLRGLPPSLARANLSGILREAASAQVDVLLIGLSVGGNYGPDYKAEFDAIYPGLAEEYGVALYPEFFAGLRAVSGMEDGFGGFLQADGLHPNAEGVRIVVAAMGPAVLDLIERAED